MSNVALSENLRVIDVDTHITEPPDAWTSRLPKKFAEKALRVEMNPLTGHNHWRIGDTWSTTPAHYTMAGWPDYPPIVPYEYEEIDPGSWRAEDRLKRMDEYGIYSQVLYPNLIGFDTQPFMQLEPDLALLCTSAYNDFLVDFASIAPNRLLPIAMVPFWDVEASVKEIIRAAETGHHGLLFANKYEQIGLPAFTDSYWDPIYAAAQDVELSINYHIGFSEHAKSKFDRILDRKAKKSDDQTYFDSRDSVLSTAAMMIGNSTTMTRLLVSGLCERFPRLRFVSVESGFGYIPYLMELLDWQWKSSGTHRSFPTLPSEYFRRQCYGSFWFERDTLSLLELYPDNIMFETDYPHPTSLSPGPASPAELPSRHIQIAFENVSPETTRKVLHDNAAKVYKTDGY